MTADKFGLTMAAALNSKFEEVVKAEIETEMIEDRSSCLGAEFPTGQLATGSVFDKFVT
jgi:hypothetical protein